MTAKILCGLVLCAGMVARAFGQSPSKPSDAYLKLMDKAWAHAKAPGAPQPVLSPLDTTVLSVEIPLKELQAQGFRVIPWTTD